MHAAGTCRPIWSCEVLIEQKRNERKSKIIIKKKDKPYAIEKKKEKRNFNGHQSSTILATSLLSIIKWNFSKTKFEISIDVEVKEKEL